MGPRLRKYERETTGSLKFKKVPLRWHLFSKGFLASGEETFFLDRPAQSAPLSQYRQGLRSTPYGVLPIILRNSYSVIFRNACPIRTPYSQPKKARKPKQVTEYSVEETTLEPLSYATMEEKSPKTRSRYSSLQPNAIKLFNERIKRLQDDGKPDSAAILAELRQRFANWAAFLGVFAESTVCLDRKLRHHVEIQDQVLRLLDIMERNLVYSGL